jgi:hypothetical protein
MIFTHTLDKVLSGKKSQTRRLIKADEHLERGTRVTNGNNRIIYQVGRTYAVQPKRGEKAVARILLTGLRRETVQTISNKDAIAEGFNSREDFIKMWHVIHGNHADLTAEVWVLEFQLLND